MWKYDRVRFILLGRIMMEGGLGFMRCATSSGTVGILLEEATASKKVTCQYKIHSLSPNLDTLRL